MWSFPRSGDHFNTDKRHFSFFRRSTRKLYLLVSKHGCTNIHATVQIVRPSFPPYSFPSYTHFTSTKCDIARDRVEFLFWDLIFQHFRSNPDFRSWPVIFPLFFLRERERESERGRERRNSNCYQLKTCSLILTITRFRSNEREKHSRKCVN